MSKFFVTCARGLEEVTAQELSDVGATRTEVVAGGVFFEGDQDTLYKAHLWLRTGNRILLPLRSFPCWSPEDLYENLVKFKWETFFTAKQTFAVECTISGKPNPALNHTQYAKLKAKDAVVDRLREKTGSRPDVNAESPDINIVIYIRDGVCTLNMDATGDSLHERGYRGTWGEAPLKETLAAGILKLCEYDPSKPILDPMCGTGTVLAEAALIAANFAPGLYRKHFLFMNWPDYHEPRWEKWVSDAESKIQPIVAGRFFGFDQNSRAVTAAHTNLKELGFETHAMIEARAFEQFALPDGITPGLMVVNPPYGERLGEEEELMNLYRLMGDTMKKKMPGWHAGIFTGSRELANNIGLKPSRRHPLFNGAIECRLLRYELYQGSKKIEKAKADESDLA